jgi:alpha-tubulin suppressor-like RCC1 family protein
MAMQNRLKFLGLCLLAALGLASGCADETVATQVVVSIEADQALRDKLTRVEVESYDPETVDASGKPKLIGKQPFEIKSAAAPKGVTFPFSFGAIKNKADAFLLVVVGFEGERAVIEQKARVGFVDGQKRLLTIRLAAACYEKLCAERDTSEWFQSSCDIDRGMCSGVTTPDTVVAGGDEDAGATGEDSGTTRGVDASTGDAQSGTNDSGGMDASTDSGTDGGSLDASNATDAGTNQLDTGSTASDSGGAKDTGALIDAQPVSCGTLTCPATADCVSTPTPRCQCKPGYTGSGTTCTNSNDCTATSCAAPSTCVDGVMDFSCTCAANYIQVNAKTCAAGFTSISAGGDSVGSGTSCARRANGTAACWGRNIQGQFGDGTSQQIVNVPVTLDNLANSVEIAVGAGFICSRRADGTVWCAGYNGAGQLGRGVTGDSSIPVQVTGLSGVAELAAGSEHICARRTNGTVACWGDNSAGQIGNGMAGQGVRSLAPAEVVGLTGAVEIAAGVYHTCARKSEAGGGSSVVCWGANGSGQLGNGVAGGNSSGNLVPVTTGGSPIGLALGEWHSCALLTGGTVTCWGSNSAGQSSSSDASSADILVPTGVTHVTNALEIAANRFYTCARLMNGSVTCWGGWPGRTASPATMVASGAAEIGAGYFHTCVRKTDGNVVCWGENRYGQIGNGATQGDNDPPVTTAATVRAY